MVLRGMRYGVGSTMLYVKMAWIMSCPSDVPVNSRLNYIGL